MQKLIFDAPDAVNKQLGRVAKQTMLRFDSPAEIGEYALSHPQAKTDRHLSETGNKNWIGPENLAQACRKITTGDESYCAGYESLMSKFEDFDLSTFRPQWRDDVAGGRPNVQNFLAGTPLSMRRRIKDDSNTAPMAIIVDTTLSAQFDQKDMQKRGSAILALLRILSAKRPVELWLGSVMDSNYNDWGCVLTRINTTPLDIATASFIFGSLAFTRRICYGLGGAEFNFKGFWAFGNHNIERKNMKACFKPAFEHIDTKDMLCIPGMHSMDKTVSDPEGWIREQIQRFAPHESGDNLDFVTEAGEVWQDRDMSGGDDN